MTGLQALTALRPSPARNIPIRTPVGDWDYVTFEPVWAAMRPGEWAPRIQPEPPPAPTAVATRIPPLCRLPSPELALDLVLDATVKKWQQGHRKTLVRPDQMWANNVILDETNAGRPATVQVWRREHRGHGQWRQVRHTF
jgi:hypothetical protein